MGERTGIAWCHHTFNPWWGCEQISDGCDNCYAIDVARRYMPGRPLWGTTDRRTFSHAHWHGPVQWNKAAAAAGERRRVFCASMADVFDKYGPQSERERLWNLIERTPSLDWLLLTKRIGNAAIMLPRSIARLPNVWLGITVVNQLEVDRDVPKLLAMEDLAGPRWLSIEPMLGPVKFRDYTLTARPCFVCKTEDMLGERRGTQSHPINCGWRHDRQRAGKAPDSSFGSGVDWVIVGGESGSRARPMETAWCLDVLEQCFKANVPFFFKQGSQANWPTFKDFASYPPGLQVREFPR